RKLVDFAGPYGWDRSASDLGRSASIAGPVEGVTAVQRRLLPMVEVRAELGVSRAELDDVDRGATDVDLADLDLAARRIALSENTTVFHGYPAAGMPGITERASHDPIMLAGE